MDSILIIGGSGFVGANLACMAQGRWKVYLTHHHSDVSQNVPGEKYKQDITNLEQICELVNRIRPAAIINTAAISNANQCVKDKDAAWALNVEGARNLAMTANMFSAKLVHISTDLVYDGAGSIYSEDDPAHPTCYYGQTKLESEKAVLDTCPDSCIARSALVYGWNINNKKCFTESLIDSLSRGDSIRLFTNEYRSPVYVRDLCEVLLKMAFDRDLTGVFNVGGAERISRYDFGIKLAEIFQLESALIEPTLIDQKMFMDHRPEDCSMDMDKLERAIGMKPGDVEAGLTRMREDSL